MRISERDFLVTEIAKTMAEKFGTIGAEQYIPVAEAVLARIQEYADATAELRKEGIISA